MNDFSCDLVDIHCHVLPGIDDGAESIEDALDMVQLSVESGVKKVICTPHSISGVFDNYRGSKLTDEFWEFKNTINDAKLPLEVYLGMEVFATVNTANDLNSGKLCTLADSRYMLIEFDFGEDEKMVRYILDSLAETDVTPVIAHPERYEFIARNPRMLYEWIDKGYLLQSNTSSVRGKFGRMVNAIVMDMLSDRLVSFIASDAHGALHRTPFLEFAYNMVNENFGEKYANEIFKVNPNKIIQNLDIFV